METIATETDGSQFDELVKSCFDQSPLGEKIKQKIDFKKIRRAASVRKHWDEALQSVKNGTALSSVIGYGFSPKDISELARLHKADKYRQKIEDLLQDCNFHTECGDFISGEWDKYIMPDDKTRDLNSDTDMPKVLELKEHLNLTLDEAEELLENSQDHKNDEWSCVFEDTEELGRSEATSIGLESWAFDYFDFQKFGEDILNRDDSAYLLNSGRIVIR